jgi:tol-pal system protein YbgF
MNRLLAACSLLLLAPGCFLFYPTTRGQALETRVNQLEADDKATAEDLQKQKDDLARQLPALTASVTELQARLDKLEHASRTSDADVGVQLESVREDLSKLRGQVEEYQHRIDTLDAGIKQMQTDTTEKLVALKGPDALKQLEANKKLASLQRPTDKTAFLKLADEQAAAGSSDVAIGLYNEFLQKWGRDPLAANAHYALGKLQQDSNNCRAALTEFEDVIKKFEKSDKVPPALMRTSECFGTLNMKDESRTALEVLAKNYPNSQEGKQAKEKLKKPAPKGKKGK